MKKLLNDFDRPIIHYWFESSTKFYKRCSTKENRLFSNDETPCCGTVKRMTIGPNIVVYKDGNQKYLFAKGKNEALDRSLLVREWRVLFFSFGVLKIHKTSIYYLDTRVLAFVSQLMDPLYDDLDLMQDDYIGYLKRNASNSF